MTKARFRPCESLSDGFDLEAACADRRADAALSAAIDRLPPLQRTLVTLYHLDEMPVGEIASVTGLPEGTVKNYLFRARPASAALEPDWESWHEYP